MVKVDPSDDTIDRWIVRWYRFDPERHERRHTIVAAFDNAAEMRAEMSVLAHQLQDRKRAGMSEDVEWISGVHHHVGHKDAMAARRVAWAAFRRRRQSP